MAKDRQTVPGELEITPDPFTPAFKLLIKRDQKAGVMGIYYSEDAGKTYQLMLPVPAATNRVGQVLMLQPDLSAAWSSLPVVIAATKAAMPVFIEMNQNGTLEANQIFGFFKVPSGLKLQLKEIQLSVQDAPAGGDLTVDIINGSNVVQGRLATIVAGQTRSSTVLSSPLECVAGSMWRLKVLGAGSGGPAENLQARLVFTVK